MTNVLVINGSVHKNGTTAKLMKKFLASSKEQGAKAKLINLSDYKINYCLGCYSEDPKLCKSSCRQKDGMQNIYPELKKADIIVFGTPVYWFNMSGLMKTFIDRLTCMAASGYTLQGKIGAFLSASKEDEGGKLNASLAMASCLNHLGLLIPPYGILFYPGREKVVKKGKVVWDDWVKAEIPNISGRTIKLSRLLEKEKFSW
ncbi:flavodoxin family protein [Candidatus Woesearchaeota archaeon]|nr:flavodoxin family protein [Candidatus Woesearchaeota archaeon]